jgi:hypothetical protein
MPGRNKYHARKTLFGGRMYDSHAEADRAAELELLEKAGEITDLEKQPRILLHAGIYYKPDFSYHELRPYLGYSVGEVQQAGPTIYEDVKGVMTRAFALKLRLWREHGPGPLRLTKRRGKTFVTFREIIPTGSGPKLHP